MDLTSPRLRGTDKECDKKYIITESQLQLLVAGLQCPKKVCKGKAKVVTHSNRCDSTFEAHCTSCNDVLSRAPPKALSGGDKYLEMNLQEVYHSLVSGIGRVGLEKRSTFMGMPPISAHFYNNHCNILFREMESHYKDLMKTCHESIEEYYVSRGLDERDSQGNLHIEVSFDGTWMTRGHRSHIGIGFVIEVYTGLIVDFEVICNYCPICKSGKVKKGPHRCHMNFPGKAGSMEAEEAKIIWSRSLQHGFVYTVFVGDGDSTAYNAVAQLNNKQGPYTDVQVVKEECINHISKRMGTRLRQIKKDTRVDVVTKKGKTIRRSVLGGQGKLTDHIIDSQQSYYGKAIRDNIGTDVLTLRKAIWASFFHLSSTDAAPAHNFCPKGENSWCFYQRALAKKETPVPHASKNLYLAKLPYESLEHIKSVYRDLTSTDLLSRCLRGYTQNSNESLHSKVWRKCPKTKFAGYYRVKFITQLATLEHNIGYEKSSLLTKLFGTNPDIEKGLKRQTKELQRHQRPRAMKRLKTTPSADYQPGQF